MLKKKTGKNKYSGKNKRLVPGILLYFYDPWIAATS